jgi:thiamine-monophosphate kinase
VAALDDDAAVWRAPAQLQVATIDTMVEDVDFRVSWPGFDFLALGRRLISINLSDLAAMGASPRHALVSVSLHSFLPAKSVARLYDGIWRQARRYGCTVAGGDISGTSGPLVLTAALFGKIPRGSRPLLRSGARPGWGIAVTGRLGDAALGLQLLEAGKRPVSRSERRWVKALLDPQPRLEAAQVLRRAGVRVAGDISDGLFTEVEKIAGAAGLGARLEQAAFPSETRDWRLIGSSEDFELICAAPLSTLEAAAVPLKKETGLQLTVVGRLTAKSGLRLNADGREVDIKGLGYEHFR